MLEPILGSENAERCLLFIVCREGGYAREIAKFFDTDLYGIQKQLDKFENGGVLVSNTVGRTRVYRFNPRYAFASELKALLQKAMMYYPADEQNRLRIVRKRPRRRGKPL